jgi:nucleoside-diphosphate-sugar epimerase
MSKYLVTGATGFIGGHVAEAAVARGVSVRTVTRATSDTSLAERLGLEIQRGDLSDPEVVRNALDDVDVVIHCAAKVGDRGPVGEYRAVNVEGLRHLLQACVNRPLRRFIHLSSLGVYEPRHHYGTDETTPLFLDHVDGYTQSKAEAEEVVRRFHKEHRLPVVILRPGFVYGPRDRTVLPRLIKRLREDRFHYLGGNKRALNTIFVGNLVDAVFLAVDQPQAVGQTYNLTDGEPVSKERFVNGIADGMGINRPHQRLPRWLAAVVSRVLRWQLHRAAPKGKSWITPAQYKFIQLNLDFSVDKARRELGYQPRVPFDTAMAETMAWYRKNT